MIPISIFTPWEVSKRGGALSTFFDRPILPRQSETVNLAIVRSPEGHPGGVTIYNDFNIPVVAVFIPNAGRRSELPFPVRFPTERSATT